MKVGMLIIMQPNIEEAVAFYNKIGFIQKFHLKEKWAEFVLGDIQFCLCPTSESVGDHHTGIVLKVDDLQKKHHEFKAAGVEFLHEPVEASHGTMASFKDPGGNIIDLYQPNPDRIKEMLECISKNTENNDKCCKGTSSC